MSNMAETVQELTEFLAGYIGEARIFFDRQNDVLVVSRDPDDPKDISPIDEIHIPTLED